MTMQRKTNLCLTCEKHNACPEQAADVVDCIEHRMPDGKQMRAAQMESARSNDWQRLHALCWEELKSQAECQKPAIHQS
jgi:hypothetical protein